MVSFFLDVQGLTELFHSRFEYELVRLWLLNHIACCQPVLQTELMSGTGSTSRIIALISIAFLLGIGATSAVYWLLIAPGLGDQLADVDAVPPPPDSDLDTSVQDPHHEDTRSAGVASITTQSLEEIQAIESTFERRGALQNLLANMDEAQVAQTLAQTEDILSWTERHAFQSAVFQRLAHLNPSLAWSRLLEVNTETPSTDLVRTVFQEWSRADLDEAIAQARTIGSNKSQTTYIGQRSSGIWTTEEHLKRTAVEAIMDERRDLSENTLRAIARDLGNEQIAISAIVGRKLEEAIGDPARAWNELAVDLQNDRSNVSTMTRVARIWIEENGLAVLDQIRQSLSNQEVRKSVVTNVLVDAARKDPANALRYALTVEDDKYNSIVQEVAGTWARTDPHAALAAASEIEEVSARSSAEEAVISTWAYSDPREVLEIIDGLPEHLQETAADSALSVLAREFPEEAAQLVASMKSGSVRSTAARSVVNSWMWVDHNAALAWVLNNPSIEDERSSLLAHLMPSLAQTDPDLAMATALSQPIEDDDSDSGLLDSTPLGLEFDLISSLSFSDLDKAIELAPAVREGLTKTKSYQTLSRQLISLGEIDRAVSMVQVAAESDGPQIYTSLATAWAEVDPRGMLDGMDRFPGKEVKSKAAMALIVTNSSSNKLSEEQVEEARKFLTDEHATLLEEGDAQSVESALLDH